MRADGCKRCGNDEEGCIHADGLCTECFLRARAERAENIIAGLKASNLLNDGVKAMVERNQLRGRVEQLEELLELVLDNCSCDEAPARCGNCQRIEEALRPGGREP